MLFQAKTQKQKNKKLDRSALLKLKQSTLTRFLSASITTILRLSIKRSILLFTNWAFLLHPNRLTFIIYMDNYGLKAFPKIIFSSIKLGKNYRETTRFDAFKLPLNKCLFCLVGSFCLYIGILTMHVQKEGIS